MGNFHLLAASRNPVSKSLSFRDFSSQNIMKSTCRHPSRCVYHNFVPGNRLRSSREMWVECRFTNFVVVFKPNTQHSWETTTLKPSLVWQRQPLWGTCSSNGESFLRNLFRREKTTKIREDLIIIKPNIWTRNLTLKVSWVICFCWTPRNRAPKLQCFTSSFFTTSIISMICGVSWFLPSAPWFPTTKSYIFFAFKFQNENKNARPMSFFPKISWPLKELLFWGPQNTPAMQVPSPPAMQVPSPPL